MLLLLPALWAVDVDDTVRTMLLGAVGPPETLVAMVDGRFGDSESEAESHASSSAHDASMYEPNVELVLRLKCAVEAGCKIPSILLCGRAGGENGVGIVQFG